MKAVLGVVLLAAASFVWITSAGMPDVVASHFGHGGAANGFSSRSEYTALMLGVVVGMPLLIAASSLLVRVLPVGLVNLPNKRHWLAPERRDGTLAALTSLNLQFAVAIAIFLCYTHWLVVRANALKPPRLDEAWFFGGLVVFIVATGAWLVRLYRRFGRV